jgi:hypothetical protein
MNLDDIELSIVDQGLAWKLTLVMGGKSASVKLFHGMNDVAVGESLRLLASAIESGDFGLGPANLKTLEAIFDMRKIPKSDTIQP